jgi:hypothetical protein
VRALGLAIRIADNLAVVAYGYKDGLPRAYADNYVEFSTTQRVGWVELLRNPSCFVIGGGFMGFACAPTYPTR